MINFSFLVLTQKTLFLSRKFDGASSYIHDFLLDLFSKMGHSRPLFLYYVFSIQLTVHNSQLKLC